MLGRGHLVVLGLGKHPQLPQLLVQLLHIGADAGLDGAEIMVLQLLALGGPRPEQGAPGKEQVPPLAVHILVNQEILLFRTHGAQNALGFHAEQLQHPDGLLAEGLHGAEQRGFLVQNLSPVGAEGGGDAQDAVLDKGVGGGIPGGVAPGLKGSPQSAGGEAGSIRLPLDKLLAGELHDDLAIIGGGNKAVVLFGGYTGHGLEPVGVMGDALFDGPVLHGVGHNVGHLQVQGSAVFDGALERLIGCLGKTLLHNSVVKNQTSKHFR